ncbi:Ionotropic receptor 68a [Frankliniella occidentalis]|nr:Ionotropic receptor 68a [Frankliniella occidentalis]
MSKLMSSCTVELDETIYMEQTQGYDKNNDDDGPPIKSAAHLFSSSLASSMLYTSGMLLGVSLPRIPTAWAVRVLTGWWITIDSLEQLADAPLEVGGWGEHQKDFFLTSLDEAGQKVGRKFEALMELRKLYGALVALGAGYLVSALALLAEVSFYRGVVMRRQGFDVYALGRNANRNPAAPAAVKRRAAA